MRKEIDGTESSNLEPALKIARGDLPHHKVGLVSLFAIFLSASAASFLVALALWRETHRKVLARPRLVVATGVVRELESLLVERHAVTVRSQTLVQVDFSVGGQSYCCRDLHYFTGNRHVGDVGKKFDFSPGQQVGVYYDPEDPRRSALIVDQPRYDTAVIAAVIGAVLLLLALLKSGRTN